MFDVDVGGVAYRESAHEQAGSEIVLADVGGLEHRAHASATTCASPSSTGSSRCAGPALLAVPSAFTAATGRDHWEVLLRARAIENQAFVLAPNQVGAAPPHFDSYGHSAIIDPWGGCSPRPRATAESFVARRPRPRRAGARCASPCPRSPTAGPSLRAGRSSEEAHA